MSRNVDILTFYDVSTGVSMFLKNVEKITKNCGLFCKIGRTGQK